MDRGAIWKLDPSTGTWTDISPLRGQDSRAFGGISIDPRDPSHLLATTINTYDEQPWGFGDHIFSSNDGGSSWVDLFGEDRMNMDTGGMPWIDGPRHSLGGLDRVRPLPTPNAPS